MKTMKNKILHYPYIHTKKSNNKCTKINEGNLARENIKSLSNSATKF